MKDDKLLPFGTSKEKVDLKNHFIKTHLSFVSCGQCSDSVLNKLIMFFACGFLVFLCLRDGF